MTVPVNPGDVIDGTYVVERMLGVGGMGAVFIAHEERLGRRVAIKVLLSAVATNADAVTRFDREARSAAALHSDHVTRVFSVGRLGDGAPYIVMELLEGEDLANLLVKRGPLPASEVIGFMTPVCDALIEAHALGIVHRDLKPANVFLARRPGGGTRVKVLDFGISKSATGAADPSLTKTTALMGTPLYMSPEQLRDARGVDSRTDIWSIGAMMYELLSGATPFISDSLTELCVFIMTTPHLPLGTRRPDVPHALAAVVDRCLQKQPVDRYQSAEELMAALNAAAAQPMAAASPVLMTAPLQAALGDMPTSLPSEAIAAQARAQAPTSPIGMTPAAGFPGPPAFAAPTGPLHHLMAPPRPIHAGTVDPVSNTQPPWLPPKRRSVLPIVLVFVAALSIGGGAFYMLLLRPSTSPGQGVLSTASSGSSEPIATPSAVDATRPSTASTAPTGPTTASPPAASVSPPRVVTSAAPASSAPRMAEAALVSPPPQTGPTALPPPLPPPVAPSAKLPPPARPHPSSLMPLDRN